MSPLKPETITSTTAGKTRIASLTGLRWFAALAVFFSHTLVVPTVPPIIQNFAFNGYMGVTIFFVLSGFIIMTTYGEVLQTPNSKKLKYFYIARFARIYPLYLTALVFATVISFVNKEKPIEFWLHLFSLQAWNSDVSVAFGLNGPGWSIGVELFFYLLFPMILLLLGRVLWNKTGLIIISVILISSMFLTALYFDVNNLGLLDSSNPDSAHRWIYRNPIFRMGDFLLGIIASQYYFLYRLKKLSPKVGTYLTLLGGLLIIFFMWRIPSEGAMRWDFVFAIPAAALVLGLALSPKSIIGTFLGAKPLVMLGEISFAFYIFHTLIFPTNTFQTGFNFWTVALYLLYLSGFCIFCWGVYKLIETPSRVWIRNKWSSPSN